MSMTTEQLEACLASIESLFEREAEFIVAGNLTELGELAKIKLEHFNQLTTAIESGALSQQPPAMINRIQKVQATASEHSRHLEAMRHGLGRILTRLGRMQSDTLVGSYNSVGSRVKFSDSVGGFESKA
nr:hypothetical protein [Hyphomonas sp. Mor2]